MALVNARLAASPRDRRKANAMAKRPIISARPIVAVTGIGVVTSLGVGKADNWEALTSGRSGIHTITPLSDRPSQHPHRRHGRLPESSSEGASRAHLRAGRDRSASKRSPKPGSTTAISAGRCSSPRRRSSSTGSDRFELYGVAAEDDGYRRLLAVGARPEHARRSSTPRSSARSPTGSPTGSARAACRSRCRPPAPPARPRSSSASRRSAAANATARCRSAPTARPPPRR